MKTDVEVLDEAIESLEQEGMWCQGSYYKYDSANPKTRGHTPTSVSDGRLINEIMASVEAGTNTILGECAEGAIRRATHYPWWNQEFDLDDQRRVHQANRIELRVADYLRQLRPDVQESIVERQRQWQCRREVWEAGGRTEAPNDPTLDTKNFQLHEYNDHQAMRASDIILAMKQAREDFAFVEKHGAE